MSGGAKKDWRDDRIDVLLERLAEAEKQLDGVREAKAAAEASWAWTGAAMRIVACVGIFFIARVAVLQGMQVLADSPFARSRRIRHQPPPADQVKDENAFVTSVAVSAVELAVVMWMVVPEDLPLFTWTSFLHGILVHVTLVEFIYYWGHRLMHHRTVYSKLHKHHHKSKTTRPLTAVRFLWLEHLLYDALFALPVVLPVLYGTGSYTLMVLWIPFFLDLPNTMGHTNFELLPEWWIRSPLYYLFYTTTYHAIHHSKTHYNYALFVPLYDIAFGTYHREYTEKDFYFAHRRARDDKKYVFLAMSPSISASLHGYYPDLFDQPQSAALSYTAWQSYVMAPFQFLIHTVPFLFLPDNFLPELLNVAINFEYDHGGSRSGGQQVAVPGIVRLLPFPGFFYFIGALRGTLNQRLREQLSYVRHYYPTVRHVGLGALNKMESLNGGGAALLPTANALGLRLVHGNTMTAAAVCRYVIRAHGTGRFPEKRALITGATSKVGRAVVLYLAQHGFDMHLVTSSAPRFEAILADARAAGAGEHIHRLEDLAEARAFKCVILGKGTDVVGLIDREEAYVATFSVPEPPGLHRCRNAETVGQLWSEPGLVQQSRIEHTLLLERGTVFACHAGTMVHAHMNWDRHEIGPVDVGSMDAVWEAGRALGFDLVPVPAAPRPAPPPEQAEQDAQEVPSEVAPSSWCGKMDISERAAVASQLVSVA